MLLRTLRDWEKNLNYLILYKRKVTFHATTKKYTGWFRSPKTFASLVINRLCRVEGCDFPRSDLKLVGFFFTILQKCYNIYIFDQQVALLYNPKYHVFYNLSSLTVQQMLNRFRCEEHFCSKDFAKIRKITF